MPTSLSRQQLILAQTETSGYGSAPAAWSAATQAHMANGIGWSDAKENYSRPIGSHRAMPMRPAVAQRRSSQVSFSTEMKGAGAAYASDAVTPDFHKFLIACGFEDDLADGVWTYQRPLIEYSGTKAVSIRYEEGGLIHVANGCRGSFKADFVTGRVAMFGWSFTGLFNPKTAGGSTNEEYSLVMPPVVSAITFDPYGRDLAPEEIGHIRKISLDVRNNVELVESVSVGTYGYAAVGIHGYGSNDDPGILLTAEVVMPNGSGGDPDAWWDLFESRDVDDTTADLAIVIGSETANRTKFQFGRLYVHDISPVDMGNLRGFTVTFGVLGTAAGTSYDDLVITAY